MGGAGVGYTVFTSFLASVVRVFFRHIDVVGAYRIPDSGPVIFVANHNNQFVDPMLLYLAIPRVVRFLIAAKSLKRPVVGFMARLVAAIGVERAQDLAFPGQGKVSAEAQATTVRGEGTCFLKQLAAGSKIKVGEHEVAVKSVESDTSCTVAPCPAELSGVAYKVLPRIDQKDMYGQVNEALKSGDCIGIFPEGGSHDQASLLDLKPGVAIMALGAMQAGAGQVQIVPCGLNYFDAYRFRSRVIVEFAPPFSVPMELLKLYETNKREAVQKLMAMVAEAMKGVMPGAKDYEELQALVTMRALYKPRSKVLAPEDSLKITKKMLYARRHFEGDPRMEKVMELTVEYNELLRATGLTDRDVRLSLVPSRGMAWRTISAIAQLVLLAPITLPTLALGLPISITTMIMAKREKDKALKASSVKVKGLDVVASYKILISFVLVPIYDLVLSVAAVLLSGLHWLWLVVFYFLGWPLFFYVGILACDHSVRALRRVRSTILFSVCQATAAILQKGLVQKRKELQKMVRELVDSLENSMDFPDNLTGRVVLPRDFSVSDHMPGIAAPDLTAPLLPRGSGD